MGTCSQNQLHKDSLFSHYIFPKKIIILSIYHIWAVRYVPFLWWLTGKLIEKIMINLCISSKLSSIQNVHWMNVFPRKLGNLKLRFFRSLSDKIYYISYGPECFLSYLLRHILLPMTPNTGKESNTLCMPELWLFTY